MIAKTLTIWIAVIMAIGALSLPSLASEGGHHDEGRESLRVPETASEIWHAIKDYEKELNEMIEAGELGGVHRIAFKIRDLAKELREKVTYLVPGKMAKVRSSVDRIADVAVLLDQYGDAGDRHNTEIQYTRLVKLLQYLEMQYPEELLSGNEPMHSHAETSSHHE